MITYSGKKLRLISRNTQYYLRQYHNTIIKLITLIKLYSSPLRRFRLCDALWILSQATISLQCCATLIEIMKLSPFKATVCTEMLLYSNYLHLRESTEEDVKA